MLQEGSLFADRYRIEKVIGQGGMGRVFRAVDVRDSTIWAIKEQLLTPANRQLLRSEAALLSRLSHPALPEFRMQREEGDYLYIVMEYIDGRTLQEVFDQYGRVDEKVLVGWFIQACRLLVYLHGLEQPVVYRDFKPSNIMLDHTGRVRIIDFGIAQQYQDAREGAIANVVALTRGFAAPEQYDRRYSMDVRTDMYALAATMHYLLTGKDPNQPPFGFRPARKLRKDVSRAIEAVLKKCLQPSPDRRYRNASMLLYDLEHLQEKNKKLRGKALRTKVLIAGGFAAALLLAVSLYRFSVQSRTNLAENYYTILDKSRSADSLEKTQEGIREAMELDPENPDAYILFADTFVKYGMPEKAAEYIEQEIVPRFPEIYSEPSFQTLIERIEGSD